jgi:hypothetical protein
MCIVYNNAYSSLQFEQTIRRVKLIGSKDHTFYFVDPNQTKLTIPAREHYNHHRLLKEDEVFLQSPLNSSVFINEKIFDFVVAEESKLREEHNRMIQQFFDTRGYHHF